MKIRRNRYCNYLRINSIEYYNKGTAKINRKYKLCMNFKLFFLLQKLIPFSTNYYYYYYLIWKAKRDVQWELRTQSGSPIWVAETQLPDPTPPPSQDLHLQKVGTQVPEPRIKFRCSTVGCGHPSGCLFLDILKYPVMANLAICRFQCFVDWWFSWMHCLMVNKTEDYIFYCKKRLPVVIVAFCSYWLCATLQATHDSSTTVCVCGAGGVCL